MPINYKEYPSNWKTEIRPAVLERANNCCEKCGFKNYSIIRRFKNGSFEIISENELKKLYEEVKNQITKSQLIKYYGFTKIILTIAHLNHDKHNHNVSLEQLKALCQKCHLQYDIKHNVANRKYGRKHRENNLKLEL